MRQTKIIYSSLILFLCCSIYTIPVFADKKKDTVSIGESVEDIIDSLFGEEKEKSNGEANDILEYLERMSPNERLGFNENLHDMSPAERKQFRKKLKRMTNEEKKEYFDGRRNRFHESRVKECERRNQMKKLKNKSRKANDQETESVTEITIADITRYLFDKQDEDSDRQVDNIKEYLAKMTPGDRQSFHRDIRDMNKEERKQFRKELKSMSPEEKRKYFRDRSKRGCKRKVGQVRKATGGKQLPGGVTVP